MAGTTLGPIIVWVDYGREGWVPESFADPEKAIEFATSGTHGKVVITERVFLEPRRRSDWGWDRHGGRDTDSHEMGQ